MQDLISIIMVLIFFASCMGMIFIIEKIGMAK